MYNIDNGGEENVRNLTKEIVNLMYERANAAKAAEEEEAEEEQEQQPSFPNKSS